jgi:hypothetical protein
MPYFAFWTLHVQTCTHDKDQNFNQRKMPKIIYILSNSVDIVTDRPADHLTTSRNILFHKFRLENYCSSL